MTTPPAPSPPGVPAPGQIYGHTLRTPTARWWKPIVGVLLAVVVFLLASVAFFAAALAYDHLVVGREFSADALLLTPAVYASSLLSLVVLLPVTWLLVRFLHGQPWGFTGSVVGRLRWSMILRALPASVVVFALYMGVFMALGPDMGEPGADPVAFALVSALLMPAQAAAEEVFFRGYLQRGVGSWFSGERAAMIAGTLVSALVFMAAHFAEDVWLNVYYLAFGVTLSIAARLTGGIEIPILVHGVNNVVSGVIGAFTTDMSRAFDRSAGVGGPFMLVQVAFIALAVALLVRWARGAGAAARVPQAVGMGSAPLG